MPTRTRTTAYALVSALHVCAAMLTCDAAGRTGRFDRSIATGQPRELINQPNCWVVENFDERDRCDIAGR